MKAAYYRGNHSFSVNDVPSPPAPADTELRIRVAYCGICGTDLHVYHGHMDSRVGFERVIGHEMSGIVDQVGAGVADFAKGDIVVVRPLLACGDCPACRSGHSHVCHHLNFVGLDSNGAFQQFWNVPAKIVHRVPASLDTQSAALVEPLAVACHSVGRARVASGDYVVVIGGGPIGLLTALVARARGATVAIAEIADFRRAFAAKLGFRLLPVGKDEILPWIMEETARKGADVVFEVTGSQGGAELMTAIVATRGRIGLVGVHAERRSVDLHRFFWREIELIGSRVYEPRDYDEAIALMADGVIDVRSLITDINPLEAINEAFAALTVNPTAIKSLISLEGDR